jgi:hypothetical protein
MYPSISQPSVKSIKNGRDQDPDGSTVEVAIGSCNYSVEAGKETAGREEVGKM